MTKKKNKVKAYDKMLKGFKENKSYVKIFREVMDGDSNVDGFILKMSKDFMLLQKGEEFRLNGYAIFRQDHYESIRYDATDQKYEKILNKEGVVKKEYGLKDKINLKTWNTIFSDLKKAKRHVIVECEDLKNPSFCIGPIEKINKKSVLVRYYDPLGMLDKKPTKINFKDITMVSFGDRYIEIFKKYLK